MSGARRKVLNPNPSPLDQTVSQALVDLETNLDRKQRAEIRDLTFLSALEIEFGTRKAIIIFVPYVLLTTYQRLYHVLVDNLEKKLRYIFVSSLFFHHFLFRVSFCIFIECFLVESLFFLSVGVVFFLKRIARIIRKDSVDLGQGHLLLVCDLCIRLVSSFFYENFSST